MWPTLNNPAYRQPNKPTNQDKCVSKTFLKTACKLVHHKAQVKLCDTLLAKYDIVQSSAITTSTAKYLPTPSSSIDTKALLSKHFCGSDDFKISTNLHGTNPRLEFNVPLHTQQVTSGMSLSSCTDNDYRTQNAKQADRRWGFCKYHYCMPIQPAVPSRDCWSNMKQYAYG